MLILYYGLQRTTNISSVIIWLLCRLLRPLLGAETWDRRCACASGWSIYGLQPLKAGRGDSLLPLVELLLIRNLVRTRGKLAAAAPLQVEDKCGADRLEARCDDSWRLETDPAGRSTAARRRTIRTQERALFKQLGELITLFTTTRRLALLDRHTNTQTHKQTLPLLCGRRRLCRGGEWLF